MASFSKPDVKSYLSVYLFLQDYYAFCKETSPGFSYETWAQDLGLSSKSYLRFATLGKRKISDELAQRFCDSLKFNDVDKEYFLILTLYSQTSQDSQKNLYGKKLTQLLRQSVPVAVIQPSEHFLAEPLCVVIRNLLSFSDIKRTPENISKILSISEEQTLKFLKKLEDSELVKENKGEWQAVHDVIKVQDQPHNETLLTYHRICLEKAIASKNLPADIRHYRAINIAFTPEEYQEYLRDLNDFASKTFVKFESSSLLKRRIYQINFNLFPWTEAVLNE